MWSWPSIRSTVLIMCLLGTVSAGCSTTPAHEEAPLQEATVEDLTGLLHRRQAAIQSLKGLFSAKVRGGILPIATRVEGAVYYQRPNAMRLRGFTTVGSELFEFVQMDDQYMLRLPTMGRVLSGQGSDTSEMGKLARPFQLSIWAMGGVLGTGALLPGESAAIHEQGDRYRLDISGTRPDGTQELRRRLWFDRRTMLVVREERLTESGQLDASIEYEDFRAVGDLPASASGTETRLLRPFKISLEDGRGRGSVQVTFHELIPNQPIKPGDLGQGQQQG
ncbi:conserved exported protein of unknown function [Nitrospira sp. KM1]|uniref:hypothetical protein n=1 Tax=Nitrospira sp. KM1 TaxID=1936990 RepID=UPI0013A7610A|nr:hypothetical protein [Nitrospira sp. KM1]BCA53455.1 conserved exported protein of unknown function [Nitrospira sp. KM1]